MRDDPGDQEDHPGDGADRGLAHRQGAGAGQGGGAVRARAAPGRARRWPPYSTLDHPLHHRAREPQRAAVLRHHQRSRARGAYYANAIRRRPSGSPSCCAARARRSCATSSAARAIGYYTFRQRRFGSLDGFLRQADLRRRGEIGAADKAMLPAFDASSAGSDARRTRQGVDEMHSCSRRFRSHAQSQQPDGSGCRSRCVEGEDRPGRRSVAAVRVRAVGREVLDALLPRYVKTRIYAACCRTRPRRSSAARQPAMKSATDNANDIIRS